MSFCQNTRHEEDQQTIPCWHQARICSFELLRGFVLTCTCLALWANPGRFQQICSAALLTSQGIPGASWPPGGQLRPGERPAQQPPPPPAGMQTRASATPAIPRLISSLSCDVLQCVLPMQLLVCCMGTILGYPLAIKLAARWNCHSSGAASI